MLLMLSFGYCKLFLVSTKSYRRRVATEHSVTCLRLFETGDVLLVLKRVLISFEKNDHVQKLIKDIEKVY